MKTTIDIVQYSQDRKQIWDEFIDKSKNGTFMFERDYMDYHSDRFTDYSLMFYDDGKLVAVLPASLHDDKITSHGGLTYGGFITTETMKQHIMLDCFSSLKQYLQQQGFASLVYKIIPHIFHKLPAEEDLYALFVNNAGLVSRGISSTIVFDNLVKMPKGRKAQVSRAKREGVIVERSSDFDTFIELENGVLSLRHNTQAVHTAAELRLLSSRFPDNIQLWIAKYRDEIIAGTVIFIYDDVVHTQYMGANDIAREIGGLDCLIKYLIDKFAGEKKYFDFGISTEDGGRYLNEGLIHQKESFGGRSICYDCYEMRI